MQAFPINPFGLLVFSIIVLVMVFLIICGLCRVISGLSSSQTTSRGTRYRPFQRRSSFPTTRSQDTPSQILDPESSPIGGLCLHCSAVIEEETESACPTCGEPRERCPICQRFIAGGQALLACPRCNTAGHSNEMRLWVESKRKCPHCGQRIAPYSLIKPQFTQV
ncbi:MAG: hypothetical protein ACFE9D_11745 [Promethearchaeota archaeon]